MEGCHEQAETEEGGIAPSAVAAFCAAGDPEETGTAGERTPYFTRDFCIV